MIADHSVCCWAVCKEGQMPQRMAQNMVGFNHWRAGVARRVTVYQPQILQQSFLPFVRGRSHMFLMRVDDVAEYQIIW